MAEAIREALSTAILHEMKDPRTGFVTVVRVEVSPDLRRARVYVSILGDEKQQAKAMYGLNHAAGFLQARVADRLQTKYTPVLKFIQDDSVKRSVEISRLIDEAIGDRKDEGGTMKDEGRIEDRDT